MVILIIGVVMVKIIMYFVFNRLLVSCQLGREKNDGLLCGLKKSIRKKVNIVLILKMFMVVYRFFIWFVSGFSRLVLIDNFMLLVIINKMNNNVIIVFFLYNRWLRIKQCVDVINGIMQKILLQELYRWLMLVVLIFVFFSFLLWFMIIRVFLQWFVVKGFFFC